LTGFRGVSPKKVNPDNCPRNEQIQRKSQNTAVAQGLGGCGRPRKHEVWKSRQRVKNTAKTGLGGGGNRAKKEVHKGNRTKVR